MGEIIINEKPLNATENKRLNVLESDIKKNFLGFVKVGVDQRAIMTHLQH